MKTKRIVVIQLSPVIISALLAAAHFLRSDSIIPAVLCLVLPLILVFRHPLAARVAQGAMLLATMEWIWTLSAFVSMRWKMDLPWLRLTLILSAVVCLTFSSALVFFTKSLNERYRLSGR